MRVLGVPAAQGTPVAVVHSGCFDAAASNSHYSQFAPASELSPRRRGLTPQFPVLESHDAQNVNTTGRHGHQQHLHAPRQLAAPAQPAEAPPQQTPQEGDIRVGSTLFNGEYRITGKLGSGTFGDVYEAVYTSTGASVAIKVARSEQHIAQMKKESTAYVHCRAKSGSIHLPRLHWAGPCNSAHIMILELLGKDIHALQQQCGGRFSEQTLSQLALKMLALLHTLHHEARCIHKDVKPANFALKDDEVYLLDLGFTRPWVDANGNHIPYDKNETRFVGTPRFASRASHRGEQSSRRDDLESLVYSLVHMHMGRLPWMHMKHAEEIVSCKDQCAMSPAMLTGGAPVHHTSLPPCALPRVRQPARLRVPDAADERMGVQGQRHAWRVRLGCAQPGIHRQGTAAAPAAAGHAVAPCVDPQAHIEAAAACCATPAAAPLACWQGGHGPRLPAPRSCVDGLRASAAHTACAATACRRLQCWALQHGFEPQQCQHLQQRRKPPRDRLHALEQQCLAH